LAHACAPQADETYISHATPPINFLRQTNSLAEMPAGSATACLYYSVRSIEMVNLLCGAANLGCKPAFQPALTRRIAQDRLPHKAVLVHSFPRRFPLAMGGFPGQRATPMQHFATNSIRMLRKSKESARRNWSRPRLK
jgi:hypothetical protein